ncbi:MAG: DNA gyrase subunit A [Myxococcota bacterium]|jgi:DNA gyrase subunit A
MDPIAKHIVPIRIQDEMRNSYMDYSMSVIIGRALPDVRDGLKPVHRRILYAMHREGLQHNKKYSKCAGVVGEVLKKYHPHGDSAVYDALVRMAQPWNLRYPLVDGQGNFGSVDGDPAAAYRYTECRMTKLAEELLIDIDKETVGFTPNFDGQTEEPVVLPSRFPNLLVNGADGIAVGMATKIPPHNLVEIVNACITVIERPEVTFEELLEIVPGPDFPTAGTIYGRAGIRDAYATGRGRVVVRGNADFEEVNGRRAIVIDEIPYQVNKARLIEQVADLVKDRKLEGIHALRDESDRTGMRIVIELKQDAFEEVVLNHLYKSTALQSTFGVILLSIVNNRPRILSLREMMQHYIAHRREVVLLRTRYELRKARERAHILEGYRIALDHIDEVIALIRASPSASEARVRLCDRFGLTEVQAQAILDLRLQRLTGLERQKIEEEYAELLTRIAALSAILADESLLMGVVKGELLEIRETYGDERRTRIVDARGELTMHDLVAEEDQVVTLSHLGYIKRCSPDEWRQQHRGGMGKRGMNTRAEDFVTSLFIANTHSLLLVFTRSGKVFPLNVYEVPQAGRDARGRPIINLVPVEDGDRVTAVVSVRALEVAEGEPAPDLLFVSSSGLVKRTPLTAFRNLRAGGMIAAGVADDDTLVVVKLVQSGELCSVMLLSSNGQCIRFPWDDVPEYGRSARGNRGIKLEGDDLVVDAVLLPAWETPTLDDDLDDDDDDVDEVDEVEDDSEDDAEDGELVVDEVSLLTVTELGFGKRTRFHKYRAQKRNGKGLLSFRVGDDTGGVVGAVPVGPEDELMLVTDTGRVIRIEAASVSQYGRVTKGVRLMRLGDGERIVDMARYTESDDDEGDEE